MYGVLTYDKVNSDLITTCCNFEAASFDFNNYLYKEKIVEPGKVRFTSLSIFLERKTKQIICFDDYSTKR